MFYGRLGKAQSTSDLETFYQLEYLDTVSRPLAEFHFKYRSREVLQHMMVSIFLVPRPLTLTSNSLRIIKRLVRQRNTDRIV